MGKLVTNGRPLLSVALTGLFVLAIAAFGAFALPDTVSAGAGAGVVGGVGGDATGAAAFDAADTDPTPQNPNLGNWTLGAVLSPVAILAWMIFKIAGLFLGLAGVVFNWATVVLVFEFSKYLGNSPGMLVAWQLLRDFGNIALLFGFVFMGISAILDLHSYPWRKSLVMLVIAAVLMNFSLFAAEAVIDGANVLAAQLYNQSYSQQTCDASSGVGSAGTNVDVWLQCALNNGVAVQLLTKLQIASAFEDDRATGWFSAITNAVTYLNDPLPYILKFVALAVVVFVAAFVLFAGAIMLISRGVVLAFLMVTSPIGVAGLAVPPLAKLAERWWHTLFNQALFAPVFLLLLFVALKMTDGLNQLVAPNGGIASAISANNVANTGSLIVFMLVIGFMIAALMLANRFGIYGADFATSTAGRLTFGAAGLAGRRFIGRPAYNAFKNSEGKAWARKGVGRWYRTAILGGMAKGNYDIRSSSAGKGIAGIAKIDPGKGQHGGYAHMVHEKTEELIKYGKDLKHTDEEKAEIASAEAATKAAEAAEAKAKADLKDFDDRKAHFDTEEKDIEAQKAQSATEAAARKAAIDAQLVKTKATKTLDDFTEESKKLADLRAADTAATKASADAIKARQDALATERNSSATDKTRLTKAVDDATKATADAKAAEADTKKQNAPERKLAEQLREEVENPIMWATAAGPGTGEIYKHAAHELEDWAGKSKSERATEKLIETIKAGQSTAHDDAKKAFKHDRADHAEGHGDLQDDHPHDATH